MSDAPYCMFLQENELDYFKYIIFSFLPEELNLCVVPGELPPGGEYDIYQSSVIKDEIQDRKYSILNELPQLDSAFRGFVFSAKCFSSMRRRLDRQALSKARFAILNGNPDVQNNSSAADAPLVFYQFQQAALKNSQYVPDRHDEPAELTELLEKQDAALSQIGYIGPWQFGPWTRYRYNPGELRDSLEKALDRPLDPGKPVVLAHADNSYDKSSLAETFAALLPHANLIICGDKGEKKLPVPGAHFWNYEKMDINLPLFGADFIMAGAKSALFAMGAMAGLKILPYCSSEDLPEMEGNLNNSPRVSGTRREEREPSDQGLFENLWRHLAAPLPVSSAAGFLERIADKPWWRKYELRLPDAQSKAFGDFQLEDAAPIAAAMLGRALENGDLGTYRAGCSLRGAYEGAKMKKAVLNRSMGRLGGHFRKYFKGA